MVIETGVVHRHPVIAFRTEVRFIIFPGFGNIRYGPQFFHRDALHYPEGLSASGTYYFINLCHILLVLTVASVIERDIVFFEVLDDTEQI